MSGKKNKKGLRLISIFLWAAIITLAIRLSLEKIGNLLLVLPIVILVCVVAFFGWWIYMGLRVNRLVRRVNEAGFQYQTTHNGEAYLAALDECAEMPGVENIALSGMPARNYLTILKVKTLREMGRTEESRALLETARTEIANDKARQLLKAEEDFLQC